jgi:hypothetical protein
VDMHRPEDIQSLRFCNVSAGEPIPH